jgi:cell division protease FtsH
MIKYGKEMMIGILPVLLFFLYMIGINVLPYLLLTLVVIAILFMKQVSTGSSALTLFGKKKTPTAPAYFSFEQIGGQERAKRELVEALEFLVRPEQMTQFGIRPLKGILLTGPPGTGKTLMARAAAHHTDSVFISVSGAEFVEMYVGIGASRIRELFQQAKQQALKEKKQNAILFIDEIDCIGGKRDGGQQREYDQTLNQLLTEIDGIHGSESPRVMLIAATNRQDILDPALLRPGRFDRQIQVDLPDLQGRKQILHLHAHNKPLSTQVSLHQIAQQTYGFSGAQLESMMNEAAIYAMRDGVDKVEEKHLLQAIDKVLMGEKADRESAAEERERVAIHELGHAIMAESLRPGSVSQVALSPRGKALGYVRHHPREERYLYTLRHIEEQILIALGGAVAEEIYYGERSTGSRNDFEHVLSLVRMMMECGLTELGIVDTKMLSQEEYNRENQNILRKLMNQANHILQEQHELFGQTKQLLLQEETISGERFRELIQKKAPQMA